MLVSRERLAELTSCPEPLDPISEVLEELHPGRGRQVIPSDYDSLVELAASAERVSKSLFWQDIIDQMWWAREAVIEALKKGEVSKKEAVGSIKAFDAFMRLPETVLARLEAAQQKRGLESRNKNWADRSGLVRKER